VSLLAVSSALFGIGLFGVLVRRDIIALLASVEVMIGGALVLLVGLGVSVRHSAAASTVSVEGIALLVVVVAAAEAAVGLALLVAVARRSRVSRVDELTEVKG
jgi:NADH:ubiquinone oxidoreductase subunit K